MTGTLYRIVVCGRCGEDYRAASPAEAVARVCAPCAARAAAFGDAIAAVMLAAIVVGWLVVVAVLWL